MIRRTQRLCSAITGNLFLIAATGLALHSFDVFDLPEAWGVDRGYTGIAAGVLTLLGVTGWIPALRWQWVCHVSLPRELRSLKSKPTERTTR